MAKPGKRRPAPLLTEADIAVTMDVFKRAGVPALVGERLAYGLDLPDSLRFISLLERVRYARAGKGLTVAQAARALGVPASKLRAVESGPVSAIEPSVFLGYLALVGAERDYDRWKRLHPVLAARLEGLPRPPERPWAGRPAEFEEAWDAAEPPKASPRTAQALRRARAPFRRVWQVHVELAGIKPPIWRRLLVAEGATLHELHLALQQAMGWATSHLYEFEVSSLRFMEPDPDGDQWDLATLDSRIVLLGELGLGEGETFRYRYDFGDGWEHRIRIERVGDYDPAQPVPACTAGRRACPPEDVGGIGGYAELVAAMADPKHEQRGHYLEWLGRPFDAERFEPKWANTFLKREQALWRRRMGSGKAAKDRSSGG